MCLKYVAYITKKFRNGYNKRCLASRAFTLTRVTPLLFVELVLGLVLLDVVLVALLEVLGQNDVPVEKTDSSGFHVRIFYIYPNRNCVLSHCPSHPVTLHWNYEGKTHVIQNRGEEN